MKYLIKILTCIFLCANINAQILTMPQIDTTINYTLNVRYISDTISIQSNQGPWDFSSGSLLNYSSNLFGHFIAESFGSIIYFCRINFTCHF